MAMDEGLDPVNHLGLAFSKGSRLARLGKDYLSGNILGTSTDALKHGGDENYEFKDSLIAGAFGGVLNAGLGQLLGKSLKASVKSLDDLNPNKAINQTEDLANSSKASTFNENIADDDIASKIVQKRFNEDNVLNSLTKAEKQEKRGIYNVTFNGKNSSEVKKYDLEALNDYIKYEKGFENTRTGKGSGAVHIQKHLEDGSLGEISKEELLDLGNVIRNGQLSLEHGKNVYRLKKDDGTIFTAVTGNKGNNEKVITFYSNRNSGKGVHTSGTITSTFPNGENLPLQNLKINKSPQDMSTQELFTNIFESMKKENPKLSDEKLKAKALEDINSKGSIAKEELLSAKLTKNTLDDFIDKKIGQENISKEQRDLIHTLHETGLVDNLNTQNLKPNIAGNYDIKSKTISLNENPNITAQQKAQGLVHELIHSSTENLIRKNPRFNAQLSLIHSEAKKSFQALGKDINVYGFTKPSKFVAEAFSNPNFAKELNSVQISSKVKEKLGLGEYINTLWEAIYSKFSQVISKVTGKEFKVNKDSYYYALQNSLNKHRNDVDVIKSNILKQNGFGDLNLDSLAKGDKGLDKSDSKVLNSIIQSDKPLNEKIAHLQNTTKEIFKTIKKPTAEQKEMYNLVMGLKSTIGIQRKDGLDVIQALIQKGYQSTQGGSGLDHIVFRHYGAGAVGELSSREILNIGKTIQQGTLTKEIAKDIKDKFSTYDNIRVYKRNVNPKDDVNLYVVVGEDRIL